MANKKPNKSKTQTSWKRYALIAVIATVLVATVSYVGYQLYLNKADADRFTALQSDFKKLQVEFNKIDPGWKYQESCTGSGLVDDFKSCSVGLSNDRLQQSDIKKAAGIYEGIVSKNNKFMLDHQTRFLHNSKEYVERLLIRNDMKGASCDLLLQEETTSGALSSSIGCSHSAQSFYFKRTDR